MTNSRSTSSAVLKKIVAAAEVPPALLITSEDVTRRKRAAQHMMEKILGPEATGPEHVRPIGDTGTARTLEGKLSVQRLHGQDFSQADLKTLMDDVSSLSLFAKKRFFLFDQIEKLNLELQKGLLDLVGKLGGDNHLLLLGETLPASSPLRKYFEGAGALIELETLKGVGLHQWISKELKRAGFNSWPEALPSLLGLMADDCVDVIVADIELLRLFCASTTVTLNEVRQLFIQRGAVGEFEYLETLTQGQMARAETLVGELLVAGKNSFMLLALIARSFVNYTGVKALQEEGATVEDMRATLGLTPWVLNKHLTAVRRYSLRRLVQGVAAIVRADSKLKNRSLGAETIFGELGAQLGRWV